MNPVFSIRKVLKDTFNAFVDNFKGLFIRILQMYAFALVCSGIAYGILNIKMWQSYSYDPNANQLILLLIAMYSFFFIMMFVGVNLYMQFQRCMWRALHNQEIPKFTYKEFSLLPLGFYLVLFFIILCGFLFLIIPGIYLCLRLQFSGAVFVVERLSIENSLRRSWDLTRGHTMKILGISLLMGVLHSFRFIGYPFAIAIHMSAYKQLVDVAHRH